MSEGDLWDRMRTKAVRARQDDDRLRHMHLVRIENGVGDGNPDVDYCIAGTTGGIELKWRDDMPARESTRLMKPGKGLRDSQILFAYHRIKAGGRIHLLVGIGTLAAVCVRLDLDNVQRVNDWTFEDFQRGLCWHDSYGWTALFTTLAGVRKASSAS